MGQSAGAGAGAYDSGDKSKEKNMDQKVALFTTS